MFALPVSKAQTKLAANATSKGAQQLSKPIPRWDELGLQHEEERAPAVDRTRMPDREHTPALSWDFSKIPISSLDQSTSRFIVAPLRGAIQAKLAVGQVDDPLEREADRVADQVMHMPSPQASVAGAPPHVGPKSAVREDPEEKLETKRGGTAKALAGEAPGSVHEVLPSPGQPLDAATRRFMEPRFGHDFSKVRVHSGPAAERSAREINAHAYTAGHNILFGAGQFLPGTHQGRQLIAHELTHVVQQSRAGGAPISVQRKPTEVDLPFIGGGLGFRGSRLDDSSVTFTPWGNIGSWPVITSFTDFPGASTGDVEISAGTKSIARISMKMHIFEDNVFKNETLDEQFHVDWDV
jgi:hypothetical protein